MSLTFEPIRSVPLTLEMALKFRDMACVNNERTLTASRLKKQLRWLERQEFFTPLWGKVMFGDKWHRVNGNHTSHLLVAILQSEQKKVDERSKSVITEMLGTSPEDLPPVPRGLHVAIEEGAAGTRDDLLSAFLRYDSKDSTRTSHDVREIFIGEQADLRGMSSKLVGKALSGVLRCIRQGAEGCAIEYNVLAKLITVSNGACLRIPEVREAVRWVINTVGEKKLYEKAAGGHVFAELYFKHGAEKAEALVALFMEIKNDSKSAAYLWESKLLRPANSVTPDSLVNDGRKAFRDIMKRRKDAA